MQPEMAESYEDSHRFRESAMAEVASAERKAIQESLVESQVHVCMNWGGG